jgi:hypothetical protein
MSTAIARASSDAVALEGVGADAPPSGAAPPVEPARLAPSTVAPHALEGEAPGPPAAPGPSPAAQAAVEAARELLEPRLSSLHLLVTAADARQALGGLSALSGPDFGAAVRALSAGGHLATLLEVLPEADQARFLEIAREKGLLVQEKGERRAGPGDPPSEPDLYCHDATLPRELGDLIHEHSKAQVRRYHAEYQAYQARFGELVAAATTPAQIRALGSPDSGQIAWEKPDLRDPASDRYARDWDARLACAPSRIYGAISARMAELTGEHRDGSFWIEAKLDGHLGLPGGEVALTTGASGTPLVKATPTLTPVEGVKLKADGAVELRSKLRLQPNVDLKLAVDRQGQLKEAAVDLGPAGVVASEAKGLGLRLTALKGGSGELGSISTLDRARGELRGGVYAKAKLPEAQLEARVELSVGLKGLSRASARQALAHLAGHREGFMDTPGEFARRVPWSSLAPERAQFLEGLGWSEAEWTARVNGGGDL